MLADRDKHCEIKGCSTSRNQMSLSAFVFKVSIDCAVGTFQRIPALFRRS